MQENCFLKMVLSCHFKMPDCIFQAPAIVSTVPLQVAVYPPVVYLHVDLCCKICYRHHKLSHQFTTIGCGILRLI